MKVITGSWGATDGWSTDPAQAATGALDGGRRSVVLFFADSDDATATRAIAELEAVLPQATVVGCSAAGLILGDGVCPADLVFTVIHFTQATPLVVRGAVGDDAHAAGVDIATELLRRLDLSDPQGTVFVLADGMRVNGARLVEGLSATLPAGLGISGGLAGDGDRFEDPWTYSEGEVHRGEVVALALVSDELAIGYGTEGGWEGFGPFRSVTGSDGTVLYTLDDRPALSLYKEYLGEKAEQLPASALYFPLMLRSPDGDVEVVRTILGVDDDTSSMRFAGEIPQGWTARLTRTTIDGIIDASAVAGEEAARSVPDCTLALLVSCVGRRMVLGQRTDEELDAAIRELGPQAAVVGFYAYGEISPTRGLCELHNQTMTITALGTRSG